MAAGDVRDVGMGARGRVVAAVTPDNPWGATDRKTLRLYQLGCLLVFVNVLAWVAFMVTAVIGGKP